MSSSEFQLSLPFSDIFSSDVEQALMQDLEADGIPFSQVLNDSNHQEHQDNDYLDCKPDFTEHQNVVAHVPTSLALTNILSNEEYSGPFDFEVGIHPTANIKNSWEYSIFLNKIYMKMMAPFPVDFKTKIRPAFPLFIRVTPQYSQPDHSQEYVHRCLHHEHPTEKSNHNVADHVHAHILRCSSSPQVLYVGQKGSNERLSLLLPFSLPQTGADNVREIFQFVCNSSCPEPGVNRRLLEVIFTLEDSNQLNFGRKSINVRICSCPKRDKDKEEKDSNATTIPKSKKRRLDKSEKQSTSGKTIAANDVAEYPLNFKIRGKHNYIQVLKYCADLMSGEVLRNSAKGSEVPFVQSLQEINAIMAKEGMH